MTLYATLADARSDNKAVKTDDDLYLLRSLKVVSRRVDMLLTVAARPREIFAPWIDTRKILINEWNVNTPYGLLELPMPLLALTSVSATGTALVVGTDVEGYSLDGTAPYSDLQLSAAYSYNWYYFCSTTIRQPFAQVGGIWGYSSDYAHAWVQVDTLRADMLDTTTETVPVNTVDGAGSDGNTPAFSPGVLIRIGASATSEMISVNAVSNTIPRTLTGPRGANGSTATTHAAGDPIYVWQVEPPIRQVVARQAAFMNARRGAFNSVEITAAGSELRYPPDLLPELRAAIAPFSYL